jgi:Na+-translocating ferredoxin:NAD+ oxidoreductase RnfE subunit
MSTAAAPPTGTTHEALEPLALCPLLFAIDDLGRGVVLTLALVFVTACAAIGNALAQMHLRPEIERPAFALVIAAATAIAARLCEAFAFDLYAFVALFLSVIASNGLALATAERSLRAVGAIGALRGALATGARAAALLLPFAIAREGLARASLFGGVGTLAGFSPDAFTVHLPFAPIGAAALPCGALLVFAAISALRYRPQR